MAPTKTARTTHRVTDNVRTLMTRLNMRQIDLAEASGINRNTIAAKLNGKSTWDVTDLELIAPALHSTITELVTRVPDFDEWLNREMATAGHAHVTGSRAGGDGGI